MIALYILKQVWLYYCYRLAASLHARILNGDEIKQEESSNPSHFENASMAEIKIENNSTLVSDIKNENSTQPVKHSLILASQESSVKRPHLDTELPPPPAAPSSPQRIDDGIFCMVFYLPYLNLLFF